MIPAREVRCTCPPGWVASDHHPEKCKLYDTSDNAALRPAPQSAPSASVSDEDVTDALALLRDLDSSATWKSATKMRFALQTILEWFAATRFASPSRTPEDAPSERDAPWTACTPQLGKAIRKVLDAFDDGTFIRNTLHDAEDGWALRLAPTIQALSVLSDAVRPLDAARATSPEPTRP